MRYFNFCIPILIFCISCSKPKQNIELKEEVNNKLSTIERGALIDDKKEGYWITFSNEGKISIECYYVNGKLNGPIKLFHDNGKLMAKGYMKNDSSNGLWISYRDNGNLQSKGSFKNGEKVGTWEFYSLEGELDRKVLYQGKSSKVLLDNHLSTDIPSQLILK